jgi:hypothetical protein
MKVLLRVAFGGGLGLFVSAWLLAIAGYDTAGLMRIALALVATAAALTCLAGAVAPARYQVLWKGHQPPLRTGWLSALGFAIAFGSFAAGILTSGWVPKPYGLWFVGGFLGGWILCLIGFFLDRRRLGTGTEGLSGPVGKE